MSEPKYIAAASQMIGDLHKHTQRIIRIQLALFLRLVYPFYYGGVPIYTDRRSMRSRPPESPFCYGKLG